MLTEEEVYKDPSFIDATLLFINKAINNLKGIENYQKLQTQLGSNHGFDTQFITTYILHKLIGVSAVETSDIKFDDCLIKCNNFDYAIQIKDITKSYENKCRQQNNTKHMIDLALNDLYGINKYSNTIKGVIPSKYKEYNKKDWTVFIKEHSLKQVLHLDANCEVVFSQYSNRGKCFAGIDILYNFYKYILPYHSKAAKNSPTNSKKILLVNLSSYFPIEKIRKQKKF